MQQIAEHRKPLTRPHFKQKRLSIVLEKGVYAILVLTSKIKRDSSIR